MHRNNITETCGACHTGVVEQYQQSAHGRAEVPDTGSVTDAPVCVDCHSSHQIVRTDEPAWFIGVTEECGACHERVYEPYFLTYHGQVTQLGFALTAKCSDCHTAHNIRAASDSESSVYPLNLVDTCAQCHSAANTNFVRYYAHGDPHDRERYPLLFWPWLFMTTLLVSVWAFFGVHTALWLNGVSIERRRARRSARSDTGGVQEGRES